MSERCSGLKLGDERRVRRVRRPHANDLKDSNDIEREQSRRIEPESRENLASNQPTFANRELAIFAILQREPVNCAIENSPNDVFPNVIPSVNSKLSV